VKTLECERRQAAFYYEAHTKISPTRLIKKSSALPKISGPLSKTLYIYMSCMCSCEISLWIWRWGGAGLGGLLLILLLYKLSQNPILGLMAVERVASASVLRARRHPDRLHRHDHARRARAASRRRHRHPGASNPRPLRRPAASTPQCAQISAPHLCSMLQTAAQYPARALSHTPGLAASQPRGSAFKASQQPTKQTPDDDDGRHAESVQ
jgi:hypothetical protein